MVILTDFKTKRKKQIHMMGENVKNIYFLTYYTPKKIAKKVIIVILE